VSIIATQQVSLPEVLMEMLHAQAERVPQLLHVVWGLSKDWCASGLRVGGLHTRNSNLMEVSALETLVTPMLLWA
jgi:hypothetical protein